MSVNLIMMEKEQNYEAPRVEIIEVEVEKGFAISVSEYEEDFDVVQGAW